MFILFKLFLYLGELVTFDTSFDFNACCVPRCRLSDLPKKLRHPLESTDLELVICGVVAYQGSHKPKSLGHYVAYCCRHGSWSLYDGLSSSMAQDPKFEAKSVNKDITVEPKLVFYITTKKTEKLE